jgi:hypothetical protein
VKRRAVPTETAGVEFHRRERRRPGRAAGEKEERQEGMSEEIAGRDDYLVAQALFIASMILEKCERHGNAADMRRLLQSPKYEKLAAVVALDFIPPVE